MLTDHLDERRVHMLAERIVARIPSTPLTRFGFIARNGFESRPAWPFGYPKPLGILECDDRWRFLCAVTPLVHDLLFDYYRCVLGQDVTVIGSDLSRDGITAWFPVYFRKIPDGLQGLLRDLSPDTPQFDQLRFACWQMTGIELVTQPVGLAARAA